jgi:hypothetical protein
MGANADVFSGAVGSWPQETSLPKKDDHAIRGWNPEDFAREQVRALVHRVFLSSATPPVRQVVFSAADGDTDVANLCQRVGQALAQETSGHIAVVGHGLQAEAVSNFHHYGDKSAIKSWSRQVSSNLWIVPDFALRAMSEAAAVGQYWLSGLTHLRDEFEYAVIHGPAATISSDVVVLGQLTDGIVLVLGAHSTRKATARKVKETLQAAQSRILGTVLSERSFPVPERIYRRL